LAILPRSHLDTVIARQALQLEVGDHVRYVGFVPFATGLRLVVLEALEEPLALCCPSHLLT
jgi:hypothetical protein